MNASRRPVFHIGANKAGSTTLQEALFARHPDIYNLGKPVDRNNPGVAYRVVQTLRDACASGEMPSLSELSFLWRQAIEPAGGRLPVFSHEELIRRQYYPDEDAARLPRAIVEVVGPVRVVIVTRRQADLLESLYIHKANVTTYLPPDQWLAANPHWIRTYCFHEIANAWADVVGQDNVGVFLFEELARDPKSFAASLADFIGIDAASAATFLTGQHKNQRKSNRTQTYVKLRSAFLPHARLGAMLPAGIRRAWHKYLEGGTPSRERLPDDWLTTVNDQYRLDNRKLAERFRLPLDRYNYPM